MIKNYCDMCKEEVKDAKFFSEMIMREVKEQLLQGPDKKMITRPQVVEKRFHFCEKCYYAKIDICLNG